MKIPDNLVHFYLIILILTSKKLKKKKFHFILISSNKSLLFFIPICDDNENEMNIFDFFFEPKEKSKEKNDEKKISITHFFINEK